MARATLAYCCTVATCDDCRTNYGDEEYGGLIHLAPGQAPDSGWRVIDGKDVCEDCAAIRECVAAGGHQWGDWRWSGIAPNGSLPDSMIYRAARANAHPDRQGGDRGPWDAVQAAGKLLGLAG